MRKIIKVDGFKRIDLSTSPTNKSDLKVTYILRSNKKNYLTSKSLYFKVGMGDLILVENESSVKKVDTKLTDKKWKVKIDDKKFFIDRVKDSENNWFLT